MAELVLYALKVFLPVTSICILFPLLINPTTFEKVLSNNQFVFVSTSLCNSSPNYCASHIPAYNASNYMKTAFEAPGLTFIRPMFMKKLEDFVVPKYVWFMNLLLGTDEYSETHKFSLFMVISSIVATIKGLVTSRLHLFSLVGFITSIGLLWYDAWTIVDLNLSSVC